MGAMINMGPGLSKIGGDSHGARCYDVKESRILSTERTIHVRFESSVSETIFPITNRGDKSQLSGREASGEGEDGRRNGRRLGRGTL